MNNTKLLTYGGMMACMAALFQSLPIFLSEAFVILTLFSALPVYIACRISPKAGLVSLMAAFLLINLISTHEALFFICTNGPVGASLGCLDYYFKNKILIFSLASSILCLTLCVMNFVIGIPVFGTALPGPLFLQIILLLSFSFIYSLAYRSLCRFIYKYVNKRLY